MLIKVEDIREIRQIAKNIADERIEIYIKEAESLDVIPYIGADFYQKLSDLGDIVLSDTGQYLKDHDYGRVTFLPVASMKPHGIDRADVLKEKGVLGVAAATLINPSFIRPPLPLPGFVSNPRYRRYTPFHRTGI